MLYKTIDGKGYMKNAQKKDKEWISIRKLQINVVTIGSIITSDMNVIYLTYLNSFIASRFL